MKIGIYMTSLTPKGASQARSQASILEGLQRLGGGRHHFFILSDRVPPEIKNSDSMTYVAIQASRKRHLASAVKRRFLRLARFALRAAGLLSEDLAKRFDALLFREPPYYQQLRELGIRLIWYSTGHELPTWLPFIRTVWDVNQRIYSMYPEYSYTRFTFDGLDGGLQKSLARASYIIIGTQEGKRELTSLYGVHERKIRVLPFPTPVLPVEGVMSRPHLNLRNDSPYVFYPARFWPHKNHVVIVAALKVLRDKWGVVINAVFSGANEGNLDYVLSFADTMGVRAQIEYVGEVIEPELVALYKNALALVYASAVGPDNLPPLEAMAVGCPAIVAEVAGAHEQYGDACLFFPSMEEESLANSIKLLADEPARREELVRKGFERAAKWSVEDYAAGVISICDEFELVARAWGSNDATFT